MSVALVHDHLEASLSKLAIVPWTEVAKTGEESSTTMEVEWFESLQSPCEDTGSIFEEAFADVILLF